LQFLTLIIPAIYDRGTGFAGWGRNIHFTALLKDASLKQTLKDFTIGVKFSQSNLIDSDWLDLYSDKIWKELDLILASISTLQRTAIHLFPASGEYTPAQVSAGFRSSMPLIEERGILIFKSYDGTFPAEYQWSIWTDWG
jgi:hypothetical protein